jgi:hypothetical protein
MFKAALFGMLTVFLLIKIASAGYDFGRFLARASKGTESVDASKEQRPAREFSIRLVV